MHKLSGRGLHLLEGARAPFAYRCLRISKASPGKKRLEGSIPAPGAGLFGPPLRPAQDPSPPPGGGRVCEVGGDKLAELLAGHEERPGEGGRSLRVAGEDSVDRPRYPGVAHRRPPGDPLIHAPCGGRHRQDGQGRKKRHKPLHSRLSHLLCSVRSIPIPLRRLPY